MFSVINKISLLTVRPLAGSFKNGLVQYASTCSVSKDGKKLNLYCDGEPERRYHGTWLRYNCRCPVCLSPSTNQNIVHYSNLVDLTIKDASLKGTLEKP